MYTNVIILSISLLLSLMAVASFVSEIIDSILETFIEEGPKFKYTTILAVLAVISWIILFIKLII